MSNIAYSRIQREIREVVNNKEMELSGINIEILDDSLTRLRGYIKGPPDSPYDGGKYVLSITVPESYPFQPPKVQFETKLWHPNVSSQTGMICLDILKDQWAASLTLRTVLLSIQALLATPEPKDPQDAVVAKQLIATPSTFEKTARYWAQQFAEAPGDKDRDCVSLVGKIMEMGIGQESAIATLSCNGWNLTKATDYLFS